MSRAPGPRGDESPGAAARGASGAVRVAEDADAAARFAAEEWTRALTGGSRERPRRALLAGGSTPKGLYRLLAGGNAFPRSAWRNVECFFGDERCVPPDHAESNFGTVRRTLVAPLGTAAPVIHRIRGEDPDPHAAARSYELLLRQRFGVAPPAVPAFDLALLGVGADGHTASLFPGLSREAEETDRLVIAVRRPDDGSQRITVTYRLLGEARRVVFLATGAEKSDAVARSLHLVPGTAPTPASRVRPASGDVVWILDRAAARLLPP